MSAVSVLKQNERMLAALAPLLAAAGALVYPAASTLLPFVLFLFLRGRDLPLARDAALRTADLAFSVYLALTVIGLGISALWSMETTAALVPAGAITLVTAAVLLYFFVVLAIALVMALLGRGFRYPLSFRLAERILGVLEKPR